MPAPEASVPIAAPIADLPSGEPIPCSTPPATTPKRRPLPLGALLAAIPSNTDAFLTRLDKCLSTPSGIDTVMLFLCYTSKLSSSVLSRLSQSALRRSAREWIALVAALPRGATVVLSSSPPATVPRAAALALALSRRLAALSSLLSEARVILRLWSLLGMYFWARSLVRQTLARFSTTKSLDTTTTTTTSSEKTAAPPPPPPPTRTETAIDFARLALCITFQTLENVAYLSSRNILSLTPAQQGAAYKWSARFWAGYVGIELGQLLAARIGPAAAYATQSPAEKSEWTLKTVRQLAWAPLTLHWSSDKGLLSETTVGLLASIPGVIQMRELWATTA
ncbi:hypothetical protein BT67DRAFT_372904 [Trichocladium antarcticum]|uniref:Peroxin 11C n=1 Tax=Trichocladium antarcticum TaxID=1450529 RepID=A0AAN6UQ96_9PEZI|nr:hypothetical protein BT67DRAFT_372904 [Trichocladium antarcticum]